MSPETVAKFKLRSSRVLLQMADSNTLFSIRYLTAEVLIVNNDAWKSNALNALNMREERVMDSKLRFAILWRAWDINYHGVNYMQKLALTSLTNCSPLVDIVRSRTQAT
jgi:hypothetical protein